MSKAFKRVSLVVMMLTFFVTISIASSDMKIAFINFEKAFNEYNRTRAENQKLQRFKEEKEKSAQVLIDEINKMKAEAEILSESAKREAEDKIRGKLRNLRDFTEDSKKELLDERNVIFKKITDEIRVIIEAYGAKEGYTLILDDKALFYKSDSMDITDKIIEIINDDEKKSSFTQK